MKDRPHLLLQPLLSDFSPDSSVKKVSILESLASQKIPSSKKQIEKLHRQLIFLMAYADNDGVYLAAKQCMDKLTEKILKSKSLQDKLLNTGIAGTATQSAFTPELTAWLMYAFKKNISIHSFDEDGIHPREILKTRLDESEFELASDEKLKALPWLAKASGTKNKNKMLAWLINAFKTIKADEPVKDQMFESLKMFIGIQPPSPAFSSSYASVPVSGQFFHKEGIIKKFDEKSIISKKLPPEKKLNESAKEKIISASRIALILLHRETDPITYSEEKQIKFFELERGMSIALFSMDSARRLPLESYIGFMMFKNGFPMSYGGAWLFGKRALIGINIFEPFRGGESAMVFAQLLRCYKMAFGAEYFEAEPYQFGKNNPEGIKSGAFWFYYRFGFRPLDTQLREKASREEKQIASQKGYRTPSNTLKEFTRSNMFVNFGKEKPLNPSDFSRYLSHVIAKEYGGDREKARKEAGRMLERNGLTAGSKCARQKLSVFFAFCIDIRSLNESEKRLLRAMLNSKCDSEFEYIAHCAAFPFEKRASSGFREFVKTEK